MRLFNAMLSRFVQTGKLSVIDAEGKAQVFEGAEGPDVTVRLTDPKLTRSLFLNPELRAGEAYMDQTLVIEKGSLRDLLMIFALNRKNLRSQPLQKSLRRAYTRIRKLHQHNTLGIARSNVAHHYDLSNQLYRLFLDEELNYSCAYFEAPEQTLEVAQRNKLRHIAAKLDLHAGQRVLDIGSGWGAMALYLAEACDVEVLGVTLSKEQHALANARAKERGLEDRVQFVLRDYREVSGQFDRIVSIGMFEHVGVGHHRAFFHKISELLPPEGVALLHSIGRMGGPGTTSPWIRKYIFPGSYAPALSESLASIEQSGLWVTDVEILRRHYAETLRAWEARFQENRDQIAEMLDERFCRMWEFYLIACDVGFRYGKQMVFQIQLAKTMNALPITRDYIGAAEVHLRQQDNASALPPNAEIGQRRIGPAC
jgi:cyclopropane-fatty-acyl-phospholipid synthase